MTAIYDIFQKKRKDEHESSQLIETTQG
jgi:hypothetical protein